MATHRETIGVSQNYGVPRYADGRWHENAARKYTANADAKIGSAKR